MNTILVRFPGFMMIGVLLWGCSTFQGKDSRDVAISEALAEAADGAQRAYDYNTAAKYYERLYKRNPDSVSTLAGLARNLRYAGSINQSIKVIRRGIIKHGESPMLLLELAKSQVAGTMFADARYTLQKTHKIAPDNWEIYAINGILLDREGQSEDAQTQYREALKFSPGNVAVLNNYALSFAQQGRLNKAISIMEKLALGENSTQQTRQNLALLYSIDGQTKKAERLVKEDLPPDIAAENLATYRTLRRKK